MKSENEIRNLLNQIGENADAETQCVLASCYSGNLRKDEEEAFKWYRKAADQGNTEALIELGLCYLHGRGVEYNEEEGLKLLQEAADQGNTEALYEMGYYYENYYRNSEMGLPYYKQAAELGNISAQNALGDYYHSINDNNEAAKWFTRSVENGDLYAKIAMRYLNESNKIIKPNQ